MMTGLREIAMSERNNSLRVLTLRYNVLTLRELVAAYNNKDKYTYSGYTVEKSGSKITIQNKNGESTSVDIGNQKLTPEQRDSVLKMAMDEIKKFLQLHQEDIESGNIKAVDIGGAVFAILMSAIVIVFFPVALVSPLREILAAPFIELARQKGRYWGSAVDELVKILKDESDLNKVQIAGVLATVAFVAFYSPGPGVLIQVGGVDAWHLTVEVGKKIGDTAGEGIEKIASVIGDIGGEPGENIEEAIKAIIRL